MSPEPGRGHTTKITAIPTVGMVKQNYNNKTKTCSNELQNNKNLIINSRVATCTHSSILSIHTLTLCLSSQHKWKTCSDGGTVSEFGHEADGQTSGWSDGGLPQLSPRRPTSTLTLYTPLVTNTPYVVFPCPLQQGLVAPVESRAQSGL